MGDDRAIMPNEAALLCHRCGYDVRAQPATGICPECAASVEESRRIAAIPKRPAWRNSDPRWRRRMLAGIWVLVCMPLVSVMMELRWDVTFPWPSPFGRYAAGGTLLDSFVTSVFSIVAFSAGVVLLFSKERSRQLNKLDWTRRWGVIMSYLAFLLGLGSLSTIVGLVLSGIGAVFTSIPLRFQPSYTDLVVALGTKIIYYGPKPSPITWVSLTAFSSCAVLLACVQLFNALLSCGSKRWALSLVIPLGLACLWNFWQCIRYHFLITPTGFGPADYESLLFGDRMLVRNILTWWSSVGWTLLDRHTMRTGLQWLIVLAIAARLTIAQLFSYRVK